MTPREIPYDIGQAINWGLRGLQALLNALPQVFADIWGSVTRVIRHDVAPMLPVLSQTQQELLIITGVVVGVVVAAFLVVQTVMLLVPRHSRATTRLPRRHRRAA
jgi:predicted PurR-regulated permease PerM